MSTNSNIGRQLNRVKNEGVAAARNAPVSTLVETLTRIGYVARGLIYGTIGVLALQVATAKGGVLADPQGAIVALGQTPFGKILLYVILVGLIGYALWGFIRAVFDPLHKGTKPAGLAARAGYLVSGISYGFLAWFTYGLLSPKTVAPRSGAQTAQTQQATASILSQPWGPWAVAVVGLGLFVVGLWYVVQGLRPRFSQQFRPYVLNARQRKWIERLGRFGTAARGIVFALTGWILFLAAYYHDPSQAQGFNGALAALLRQPYGPWLLGVVAAGLIAFGIYSVMSGIWLRLKR